MQQKNRCDRVKRPKGERHGMHKLIEKQIQEIRIRRNAGEILRTIAEDFGVSLQQIHRICTGAWKHII